MYAMINFLAAIGDIMQNEWNSWRFCDHCYTKGDLVPAYSLVAWTDESLNWHHDYKCQEHCEKYVCHHCGYSIIIGTDAFVEREKSTGSEYWHWDCWYDDDNAEYVNPIAKGMTLPKFQDILKRKYDHACAMYAEMIVKVDNQIGKPEIPFWQKGINRERLYYWNGKCEALQDALNILEGLYDY